MTVAPSTQKNSRMEFIRIKLHPFDRFSLCIRKVISVVSTFVFSFFVWMLQIPCQGKTNYIGALIVREITCHKNCQSIHNISY